MPGPQAYDERRFEELVLYIAEQTRGDQDFGRTKLAKVLFYCDFDAYADDGQSLTGETYRAFPFGPFPAHLEEVERRLAVGGRATVERLEEDSADRGEYEPFKIVPHEAPDVDFFEPWELEFVNRWISRISEATATQISDLSHEHPGWLLAREGREEIPYESSLLSVDPPRPEVRDLARRRFADGPTGRYR